MARERRRRAGLSKLNSMRAPSSELKLARAACQIRSTFQARRLRAVRRHRLEAGRADGRWPGVAPVKELPRKEVIQPQLPLRLPCYDFTPVASPTFDGSLPKGLGHRLRVLLTPMV